MCFKQARNLILREIKADREARLMKSSKGSAPQQSTDTTPKAGDTTAGKAGTTTAAAETAGSSGQPQKTETASKQALSTGTATAGQQTCTLQVGFACYKYSVFRVHM